MNESKVPDISASRWKQTHPPSGRPHSQFKGKGESQLRTKRSHVPKGLVPMQEILSRSYQVMLLPGVLARLASPPKANNMTLSAALIETAASNMERLNELQLNAVMLAEQGVTTVDIVEKLGIAENALNSVFRDVYVLLEIGGSVRGTLKRPILVAAWRKYVQGHAK